MDLDSSDTVSSSEFSEETDDSENGTVYESEQDTYSPPIVYPIHNTSLISEFERKVYYRSENEDYYGMVAQPQGPTPRQKLPVIKEHVIFGKSINIVDFLKSRELGERLPKARRNSTLLSFALVPCWSTTTKMNLLLSAKTLLRRKLYRWEGATLEFLQRYAMKKTAGNTLKSECLSRLTRNKGGIIDRIAFIDIFNTLKYSGIKLEAKNEHREDLLIRLIKNCHEAGLEFMVHLIKRGFDFKERGNIAMRFLCSSFTGKYFSESRLKLLNAMFDAGLELDEQGKEDLVIRFSRNILKQANQFAVKALDLLLRHGCQANRALVTLEKPDFSSDLYRSPDRFESMMVIAERLVENGAQLNDAERDQWMPCFLVRILLSARGDPNHASMLSLIRKSVAHGFNVRITDDRMWKTILMVFCARYKNKDLPDVVRLLCSSGIDVNAVDRCGRDALFYLLKNEPANRQSIYATVRVLVELNIDVNRSSSSCRTAFIEYLSRNMPSCCCYFRGLKRVNESFYWEILGVLLDAGFNVSRAECKTYGALIVIFDRLRELMLEVDQVCQKCLKNDFASVDVNEVVTALGTVHFEKALKSVDRLIKAGASVNPTHSSGYDSPLVFVCASFSGEQLVSLVKLLCENGADVNRNTLTAYGRDEPCQMVDVMRALRQRNDIQAHLVDRLIEIMKPFGYKTVA